jgi:hypothetical protein
MEAAKNARFQHPKCQLQLLIWEVLKKVIANLVPTDMLKIVMLALI